MQRHLNTFNAGMKADVDKHVQPSGTYRFAENGRVLFNRTTDEFDGKSTSFSPVAGNEYLFSFCPGYRYVHHVNTGNDVVFFSSNGTNSQIGIYNDTDGYQILFDDKFDPNGDKLYLTPNDSTTNKVSSHYIEENSLLKRIYYSDGIENPYVFNIAMFYNGYSCNINDTNLSDSRVHIGGCDTPQQYPPYLSVHNFVMKPDVVFPDFYFNGSIDGSLKRGVYQYAMRYFTADGHRSPWSQISRHIVLTGKNEPIGSDIYTNHHNRSMGATGNDSVTSNGIEVKFDKIDTRWSGIEVAYIYSKTESVTHEANIFYTNNFSCGKVRMTSSITISHLQNNGVSVPLDNFNERLEVITKTSAMSEKDNVMYFGGVELLNIPEGYVQDVKISPLVRSIIPDETLEPRFTQSLNPISGRLDNDPLTNSTVVTKQLNVSKFTGENKVVEIKNDYENYKGQQVEHSFTGLFRGETYPYALVIYDRKGNPSFAKQIGEFTTPTQYEPGYNLTELKNNRYEINILGAKISGIKIPKKNLYDKHGKLNVSGFAIVRAQRSGNILHQGIVTPIMDTCIGAGDSLQCGVQVKPYPLLNNKFETNYNGINGTAHGDLLDTRIVRDEVDNDKFVTNSRIVARYANYYSPDVLIEGFHNFIKDRDYIQHVGTAHKAYTQNEIPLIGSSQADPAPNVNMHFYTKSYNTDINRVNGATELSRAGRSLVSETSRLKFAHILTDFDTEIEAFDEDVTEITYKNGVIDFLRLLPAYSPNSPQNSKIWKRSMTVGVRNALVLGMMDYEHIDIWEGDSTSSYRIVNYLRPNDSYFSEESGLSDTRQYQATGHFQQITEAILSKAVDEGDGFVFNDIEVWGGDCFVNLFDFTRIVPFGAKTCDNSDTLARTVYVGSDLKVNYNDGGENFYKEMASSIIVPIESKYNIALRYGRSFAANATYPQVSYCENVEEQKHFSNGIMSLQPESFDMNRSLLHQENVQFFTVKPENINLVYNKESSIYSSDIKVYSEVEDSYRKVRVNNFYDLNGSQGRLVGLVRLYSYMYAIQEYAYGILRVNERAIVPTSTGEVLLGTGRGMNGIDYISTDFGCQHPKSITTYKGNLYFFDNFSSMICRHGQSGRSELSDEKGLHDFVFIHTNTKNITDVECGVDNENGDIYLKIKSDEHKLLVFNHNLSVFHGFDKYIPSGLLSINDVFHTIKSDGNSVWKHGFGEYGKFYGEYYKTILRFIVNPASAYAKVFDNMSVNVTPDNNTILTKFVFKTRYQEQEIDRLNDGRVKYRDMALRFPTMGLKSKTRLLDNYLEVEIEIDNALNTSGKRLAIPSVETLYRMSNRR